MGSHEKKKLVIVLNSRLHKHGGFEDFMIWCARKARARNWELTFILRAVETPAVQRLIEAEQAVVHVVKHQFRSSEGARALGRKLAELRPDVADFHFCDSLHMLRVYRACRRLGTRVVTHYHGEIRSLDRLSRRNRHLSLLRLLSLFAHRIITVSRANKRFLEALHIRTPVDTIYNGIDVEAFKERATDSNHLETVNGDRPLQFIYLGQLIDRKQAPVLIQAFALVRRKLPRARLMIIGGGAREAQSRQVADELGLSDSVDFAGVTSEFPYEEMRRSDIFVSASESESFGIVFAEAMWMGLPVVACRVGGIPEVVADHKTGLLVPPRDPEALAAAMTTLARDAGLRRRMGTAGRQRVAERFDWPDKVDATFDVFDELTPPR